MTKPSKTVEKVVVSKEVEALVASLSGGNMETNARAFSKGVGRDVKLNNFLNADLTKGIARVFGREEIKRIMSKVDNYGFTDQAKKEALIVSLFSASIEDAVREKRVKLTKGLNLTERQTEDLAKKLTQYGSMLDKVVRAGARQWAKEFGLIVEETVTETPAKVEEVAAPVLEAAKADA